MNYLAHLALADDSPDSIVGNFLGDFVKGRPEGRFAPAVVRGIRLHRSVDRFTDGHACVRRAIERLPRARRRFAGIAIDMAFDHFLARRWQREEPDDFLAQRRHAYAVLSAREATLPASLQRILPSLRDDDWLGSYAEFEGIAYALRRMSQRLSRANPLAELATDVEVHYAALDGDFQAFWPDVQAFAQREQCRLEHHYPE